MIEFEERADQLTLESIDSTLADGQIFIEARKKLLARGAKLLVGPRGTGKTHLMRYTYSHALKDDSAPLALYSSFNRYLNLEPLLKRSPDALKRFHSWVVAKLLISAFDCLHDGKKDVQCLSSQDPLFDEEKLRQLVALLERGTETRLYEDFGQLLTVDHVLKAVTVLTSRLSRKRAVLLLDDAALSLSDQYLAAFFEIFRLLKTDNISPKASVYPGSTQYGPTFHASHEAEEIWLWLSIENSDYSKIMGDIANRRLSDEQVRMFSQDTLNLFKYVSFGIPRVFLRFLREYIDLKPGTSQQKINKIIENQAGLIGTEYDSLGLKLKQFSTVVTTGRKLFDRAIAEVAKAQNADQTSLNITLGIMQDSSRSALADRMLRFLVEVGLLFPVQAVSHGPNRKYSRFIPHLAFLYQQGAFKERKSTSLSSFASIIGRTVSKHPVRRALSTLLSPDEIASLKLDLPPCDSCGTQRLNDSQRFCHQCGEQLVESSLFEECMKLPLENIPNISKAMIARIHGDTKVRTIGDVFSSQNAYGDLQQAYYVGPVKAERIIGLVTLTVNEFLS